MRKVFLLLFFSACIVSGFKSYAATESKTEDPSWESPDAPSSASVPLKPFSYPLGSSTISGACEGGVPPLPFFIAYGILRKVYSIDDSPALESETPRAGVGVTSPESTTGSSASCEEVLAYSGSSGGGAAAAAGDSPPSDLPLKEEATDDIETVMQETLKDTILTIKDPKDLHYARFFTKITIRCEIVSESLEKLKKALSKNITRLDFARNHMGATGIIALAPILARLTNLTHLYLLGNNMGAAGITALASRLSTLTNLIYLNLAGNNMGDDGFSALIPYLQKATRLKRLYLRANSINFVLIKGDEKDLAPFTDLVF